MRQIGSTFVCIALIAIALASTFIWNDFHLRVLFNIGVYFIAASGLNVLVGQTGQKSLGHAGLFAVGAYTAALLTVDFGFNPWFALVASGVLAGLFGIVIALPALRVRGPSLSMVTIAFGIVIEKIVSEWNDVFGGQEGIFGVAPLEWNGIALTNRQWVLVVFGIGLGVHLVLSQLLNGRFGRGFRAVATSEIAAESVGVSVYQFKVLAFVISAVTCGIAGALIAQQNQYINSDFITFNLSVFFLVLVLFGGPTQLGSLFGAVILTLLDASLARWPYLQHIAYGALLLLALYAMPEGLSGWVERIVRRIRPAPSPEASAGCLHPSSRVASVDGGGPILSANHLHKNFGGIAATRDVSLAIARNSVTSLIGPNGAGKTTLLNILAGTIAPTSGVIRFQQRPIEDLPPNRRSNIGIARTFQNLKLFSGMTVLENVIVGGYSTQRAGFLANLLGWMSVREEERRLRAKAMEILHFVNLARYANEPAISLPYGLQRKLEIARAIVSDPVLLLLDEPAAGLNPAETAQLMTLISSIRDRGVTVLLIEHHMEMVMAISDNIVVLDYGAKISEGAPDHVRNDPAVINAYLGADPDEDNPGAAAPFSTPQAAR